MCSFDQCLTFHDHISGIYKSPHFHLHDIGGIRNLSTVYATAQLNRYSFRIFNSILYKLSKQQD